MSSTAATATAAHESLYTLLEGLKDDGHMTDGSYLTAMNALQAIYAVIPHSAPAPAPTPVGGAGFSLTLSDAFLMSITTSGAQYQSLLTAWYKIFNNEPPSYFHPQGAVPTSFWEELVEDWVPMLNILNAWAEPILAGAAPTSLRAAFAASGISVKRVRHLTYSPHFSFRHSVVRDAILRDKWVVADALTTHLYDAAETAIEKIADYNMCDYKDAVSRYLGARPEPRLLVAHYGKDYAAWTPTAHFHRIRVEIKDMPAFEAWTPLIQLSRSDITRVIRMLYFIHMSSNHGIKTTDYARWVKDVFVPHMKWRKDDPSMKMSVILQVSGITAKTRGKLRTYGGYINTAGAPFFTITYLDPLNVGDKE
jgi:hypothetical protein